jgi:hypothetical protein
MLDMRRLVNNPYALAQVFLAVFFRTAYCYLDVLARFVFKVVLRILEDPDQDSRGQLITDPDPTWTFLVIDTNML